MDESKIVEALRANIPKAPVEAPAIQEAQLSAESELIKPTSIPDELAAFRLMDYFGLSPEERQLTDYKDMLGVIYTWASADANSTDSLDVITKIRELEQRLGLTFREDGKLQAMHRWIKLDTQRRQVEKEMALV